MTADARLLRNAFMFGAEWEAMNNGDVGRPGFYGEIEAEALRRYPDPHGETPEYRAPDPQWFCSCGDFGTDECVKHQHEAQGHTINPATPPSPKRQDDTRKCMGCGHAIPVENIHGADPERWHWTIKGSTQVTCGPVVPEGGAEG